MKLVEFIKEMNKICPEYYAEDWDNPGLQVGDLQQEIKAIYLALDLKEDTIINAIKCNADLILTHHPLLFRPIKKVTKKDFIGKRIYSLIENHMAHYAMHTNFDAFFMREIIDKKLGLKNTIPIMNNSLLEKDKNIFDNEYENSYEKEYKAFRNRSSIGIGSVGELEKEITVKEIAEKIIKEFKVSSVRIFGDENRKIKKVGVLGGSGKSEIDTAISMGASLYISGDVDHHAGLDAVEKGISIIDAGHFGLEHVFTSYMKKRLSYMKEKVKAFSEIKIEEEEPKEPFTTIYEEINFNGRRNKFQREKK